MKLESNQIKMLAHHNMNRKHWIRVRVAALETLTALSVSPLLPEEGGVISTGVVLAGSAEARGQKETHRDEKREVLGVRPRFLV